MTATALTLVILQLAAFGVGVGSLLAAALAQLGRRHAAFDALTHFAPLYLAGGLAAALEGVTVEAPGRALIAAMGIAASALALALLAPEYLRDAGPRGEDGSFTLVQFNVWGDRADLDRVAAWFAELQPDVVVAQETTRRFREHVAEATGLHVTIWRSNLAIFSREPPLPFAGPPAASRRPMSLVGVTVPSPLGPVSVLGVHYPWPTEYVRLRAAEALAGVVRGLPFGTTILAGDFNSTPWSFTRRREDRAFGLIRRTRAVFSWPATLRIPLFPIDHLYAGSDWATVKVIRGPKLGSDHYPVVVTLAPRARR